jgi:hypothetical protein
MSECQQYSICCTVHTECGYTGTLNVACCWLFIDNKHPRFRKPAIGEERGRGLAEIVELNLFEIFQEIFIAVFRIEMGAHINSPNWLRNYSPPASLIQRLLQRL